MEDCSPSVHMHLSHNSGPLTSVCFSPFARVFIRIFDCYLYFLKRATPNARKSVLQQFRTPAHLPLGWSRLVSIIYALRSWQPCLQVSSAPFQGYYRPTGSLFIHGLGDFVHVLDDFVHHQILKEIYSDTFPKRSFATAHHQGSVFMKCLELW